MLYLKPANFEDIEKEHLFVASVPTDENGFTNDFFGISFEDFKRTALPRMIDWSIGKNLPEGFVPETIFFLWSDENQTDHSAHKIVGELRLRHHLVPSLENGSGHVGQFIKKEFRGKGYCTEGLRLLIEEAKKVVPEKELYLHCNLDNPASLKVMQKNGGVIHHKNENGFFVRINLKREYVIQPFNMKNIPHLLDILTPMWCAPYGDDNYRRFSVEHIIRNNIFENDYRFQLVEENSGDFLSAAFFARKGDKNKAGEWLSENFNYPKDAMIPLELSRKYIDEMDEKTQGLMHEKDIQLTLFVSTKSGCGSLLLELLCEKLKAEGWENLYLWTDCDCNWKWYEKHGFTLVQEGVYEAFSSENEDYKTYIFKRAF